MLMLEVTVDVHETELVEDAYLGEHVRRRTGVVTKERMVLLQFLSEERAMVVGLRGGEPRAVDVEDVTILDLNYQSYLRGARG